MLDLDQLLGDLHRTEYGKIVAVLTRRFGFRNFGTAEDIAQEAWITAAAEWKEGRLPNNPAAWLMQVAKNRALNVVKREGLQERVHASASEADATSWEPEEAFFSGEIDDAVLRMVFACCHPDLKPEDQIVLILKTLGGFGIPEIASALLASEDAIEKRFTRARRRIVDQGIELEVPTGIQLAPRLTMAQTSLYLLFNEGYSTSVAHLPIRSDLCVEALRLCRMIVEHFPQEKETRALLSLMYFHSARLPSRMTAAGALIVFAKQDRSLWDQQLIAQGMFHLTESIGDVELSSYHLEASIAAQHCIAPSFEETNWSVIRQMYETLSRVSSNPLVQLNLAIVERFVDGLTPAIRTLESLRNEKKLARSSLLYASLAEFVRESGDPATAERHYARAQQLATSDWERELLANRAASLGTAN